jgi:hypothetical protein
VKAVGLFYYNSTENETELKKRRYTCKTQMTSVKEGIIPLSSKNHSQLDELFM